MVDPKKNRGQVFVGRQEHAEIEVGDAELGERENYRRAAPDEAATSKTSNNLEREVATPPGGAPHPCCRRSTGGWSAGAPAVATEPRRPPGPCSDRPGRERRPRSTRRAARRRLRGPPSTAIADLDFNQFPAANVALPADRPTCVLFSRSGYHPRCARPSRSPALGDRGLLARVASPPARPQQSAVPDGSAPVSVDGP